MSSSVCRTLLIWFWKLRNSSPQTKPIPLPRSKRETIHWKTLRIGRDDYVWEHAKRSGEKSAAPKLYYSLSPASSSSSLRPLPFAWSFRVHLFFHFYFCLLTGWLLLWYRASQELFWEATNPTDKFKRMCTVEQAAKNWHFIIRLLSFTCTATKLEVFKWDIFRRDGTTMCLIHSSFAYVFFSFYSNAAFDLQKKLICL